MASERTTPDISVRGLIKCYGDVVAVDRVDLDIAAGEFFTMLGPSGSGKTTSLPMIAGFEVPDEGTIELAGEDVSRLPPYDRPVNTVFQDYALFWTIVIGHATFCIVVLYNNAVARMRRSSGNLDEASMDLGADAWQTFRHVTFPQLRSALLAGALLAFALSFDEVVVTIFTSGAQQTLPIWMFTNFARPRELPVVNVVALFVIVASIIPVWFAQRLAGGSGLTSERPTQPAVAAAIEAKP